MAVANITAMRDERVPEHVLEVAPFFRAGLDDIAARHQIVKQVRGNGFFYGIELMAGRDTGREFNAEGRRPCVARCCRSC